MTVAVAGLDPTQQSSDKFTPTPTAVRITTPEVDTDSETEIEATAANQASLVPTSMPVESAEMTSTIQISTQVTTNIRYGPSLDQRVLGDVKVGEQLNVLGRTEAGDWWLVCCTTAGQEGWIWSALVATEGVGDDLPIQPTPLPAPVAISEVFLNVRDGPASDYPVLALMAPGLPYEVKGETDLGFWLLICCVGEDKEGWVYRESVTLNGDVASIPIVTTPTTLTSEE
jgi:SH3-like domain-containing protein